MRNIAQHMNRNLEFLVASDFRGSVPVPQSSVFKEKSLGVSHCGLTSDHRHLISGG